MTPETLAELKALSEQIHENVRSRGYWQTADKLSAMGLAQHAEMVLSKIALIHTELSEAVEAVRRDRPQEWGAMQNHAMVRELAGTMVRIIDVAQWLHLDLWQALAVEVDYNEKRPKDEGKVV